MADKPNSEKKIKGKAAATKDSAVDKTASVAGATHEAPSRGTSRKKGKLLPKNKHRLPRRQKKAQHKAAARL